MALYKTNMSPQKTASRASAYTNLPRKQFYAGKHIVIASRECGDIRFLLDHGVKPSNIIACDVDQCARAIASGLGVVISPEPTIQDTVLWAFKTYGKANIASINVDLCMGVRQGTEILAIVFDACETYNYKGAIFFTFHRVDRTGGIKCAENIHYITDYLNVGSQYKRKPEIVFNYQSYTPTSVGSPMCMIAF